jgi:hypothetical protein
VTRRGAEAVDDVETGGDVVGCVETAGSRGGWCQRWARGGESGTEETVIGGAEKTAGATAGRCSGDGVRAGYRGRCGEGRRG